MKKLLLVSVIAIASAAAMIAPAAARSHVFIGIGGFDNYYGNDYYDGYGDYGGGRYVFPTTPMMTATGPVISTGTTVATSK